MSMFSPTGAGYSIPASVKKVLQDVLPGTASGSPGGIGAALPGLLGAGVLGGIAGALLSGKGMKKIATGALTVGGGVAAGTLAWSLYRKWSAGREAAATPAVSQTGQAAAPAATEDDGMVFLEAMVFAARADGHMDAQERARIAAFIEKSYPGQGVDIQVETLLNGPMDLNTLAARIRTRQEAQAVYTLSCFVLDIDHFMERAYLDALAESLGLDRIMRESLEQEAEAAKRELMTP